MFIVRNERYKVIALFALISDAYKHRDELVNTTRRDHTVSYMPAKVSYL